MEFAGSSYVVPLLIIALVGGFIGYELWRRRGTGETVSREVGGSAQNSTAAAELAEPTEPAVDELIVWHRQFEYTVFHWLQAAEAALARKFSEADLLVGGAVADLTAGTTAAEAMVEAGFLEAAEQYPALSQREELRLMHSCVQAVLQTEPGDTAAGTVGETAAEAGEETPTSDDLLEQYLALRDVWAERLRQLTQDDRLALQLLAMQGR